MKKALCIFLAMMLCASASAQNIKILNNLSQNDVSARDNAEKGIPQKNSSFEHLYRLEQVNVVNSDGKKALYVKIRDITMKHSNEMVQLSLLGYLFLQNDICEYAIQGDNIEEAILEIIYELKPFFMIKGKTSDYKLYKSEAISIKEYNGRLEVIPLYK